MDGKGPAGGLDEAELLLVHRLDRVGVGEAEQLHLGHATVDQVPVGRGEGGIRLGCGLDVRPVGHQDLPAGGLRQPIEMIVVGERLLAPGLGVLQVRPCGEILDLRDGGLHRDLLLLGLLRIVARLPEQVAHLGHERRRERRVGQDLEQHLRRDHVLDDREHADEGRPDHLLLVRRGRGVVDHDIEVADGLVADQRHDLGALVADDPDQAPVREIALDEVEPDPADVLPGPAQGVEQRGQDRHGRLLALVFQHAGLLLALLAEQFEVHPRRVADREERELHELIVAGG